ncbi:MAG: hypothetical protein QNJ29_06740 [Rhizobiaceae bacterium]|nr:hypothetical protein [Rhizobiaceae bacterium]
MRKSTLIGVALLLLAGCSSTADKIEDSANRLTTSWAQNKPYAEVAALGNRPIDQLTTTQVGFGQMIGQSQLADGSTLYRHIAPGAERTTEASFGIVDSESSATSFRLSYFKVGPNGIVNDWATGSVPGSFSKCTWYIGGIFRKCEDQAQIKQTLATYDTVVKTSGKQPISSWGAIQSPQLQEPNAGLTTVSTTGLQ